MQGGLVFVSKSVCNVLIPSLFYSLLKIWFASYFLAPSLKFERVLGRDQAV